MAYFVEFDERNIHTALEAEQPVFLAAPRSSGLTFWCLRTFWALHTRDRVSLIDCLRCTSEARIGEELSHSLGVATNFTNAEELLRLLNDRPVGNHQKQLIVFLNAHRAAPDAMAWLLRLLLEAAGDRRARSFSFLVEGSLDYDAVAQTAFPSASYLQPTVIYTEPPSPWRLMVETEDIRRLRFAYHPEQVTPWITDITGGDTSLAIELFKQLPRARIVSDTDFGAAHQATLASPSASELSQSVAILDESAKHALASFCKGRWVAGHRPPAFPNAAIKRLFLSGLVAFDPLSHGYRLRSSLLSEIVSSALPAQCVGGLPHELMELLSARTTFLMSSISTFERFVRLCVSRDELAALAATVSSRSDYASLVSQLKREIATSEPLKPHFEAFRAILGRLAPDRPDLWSTAVARAGGDLENAKSRLATLLTLRELGALAQRLGVLDEKDTEMLERIGELRNDVAHFRPTGYARSVMLLDDISTLMGKGSRGL